MNYWLISIALSGWAAGASVLINLQLAFFLPIMEYSEWIKTTALLPLTAALIAPFSLMSNRITPEHESQSKHAGYILFIIISWCSIIAIVLAGISLDLPPITYFAGTALWIASIAKVALDGLLLSPYVIQMGMSDKIIRSITPTLVFLTLLLIRPSTAALACIYIAGATGLTCIVAIRWLKPRLNKVNFNARSMLKLYWNELPSGYLSLISLGVFSIPLFIFSKKSGHDDTATLGIALTVAQGAAAFTTMMLSRHSVATARILKIKEGNKIFDTLPFVVISIFCSISSTILIAGYGFYHGMPNWIYIAIATSILVLIETLQGSVTGILLRLGDRKIITSATISAILNIALATFLDNPVALLCTLSLVQLLSFFMPGLWRLHKHATKNSVTFKILRSKE